jgi:hypothetical protein
MSDSAAGAEGVYWPLPVTVTTDLEGRPRAVEGAPVASIREEWLVEDRWWTPKPLRRRYFELVLVGGRCAVVFCELAAAGAKPHGHWFEQRG